MEDCAIRQLDRGQQKPCFANVYPRDAMLAWYNYAIVLCLSVCPLPVEVVGRLKPMFGTDATPTLCYKGIWVSSKITLLPRELGPKFRT